MSDNVSVTAGVGTTISTDDVGGVHFQRVKLDFGGDGASTPVISGTGLPVDSELPAAAVLADATALPTVPTVGAGNLLYNGATLDLQRANMAETLLASAARTATTDSATQTNYNGRGVVYALEVTAQPGGAETLSLSLQIMPLGFSIFDTGVVITAATGIRRVMIYPGVLHADILGTGSLAWAKSLVLPRSWRIRVTHSGAGSWTYALTAMTIV